MDFKHLKRNTTFLMAAAIVCLFPLGIELLMMMGLVRSAGDIDSTSILRLGSGLWSLIGIAGAVSFEALRRKEISRRIVTRIWRLDWFDVFLGLFAASMFINMFKRKE